jgi:hypothetical protein
LTSKIAKLDKEKKDVEAKCTEAEKLTKNFREKLDKLVNSHEIPLKFPGRRQKPKRS